MAGTTFDIDTILQKDALGKQISELWHQWDNSREEWKKEKVELRNFIFAIDTADTSNRELPWNNKTHIPKLCQIRDNLIANYMASLFPKRKWLMWEAGNEESLDKNKIDGIREYMFWAISQKEFKEEIAKLIADYVDYGNTLGTTSWVDTTSKLSNGSLKPGYIGPRIKRLNPLDVVTNPISPSVNSSPKILRSLWTLGEAKKFIISETSTGEQRELAESVWQYIMDVRHKSHQYAGEWKEVDNFLNVDGFSNFRDYLGSNYVEVLSFYGDIYNPETDELLENHLVHVVDRHKVVFSAPIPFPTGEIPIRHSGWRVRQDNNWAMGPLDNLVGMQYRIDHVENLKADLFDLTIFPPVKVRGQVEDFEWGPMEKIYTDNEGDVDLMNPKAEILTANIEIQTYEQRMEEMAGSPKEAMGFRTPGEKTAYEVQRLENAASRIFQNKIKQFEEQILEPLLNDMLALAQQNLTSATIKVIDDEFKSEEFIKLTKEDISAVGRIKPIAARHFAEKAELIQNLNNLFNSAIGSDPEIKAHFSTIKMAQMLEELLGFEDYNIVQTNVRISEQAQAQSEMNAAVEQAGVEALTPAGIAEDDFDE